jgi:hypothetical protein
MAAQLDEFGYPMLNRPEHFNPHDKTVAGIHDRATKSVAQMQLLAPSQHGDGARGDRTALDRFGMSTSLPQRYGFKTLRARTPFAHMYPERYEFFRHERLERLEKLLAEQGRCLVAHALEEDLDEEQLKRLGLARRELLNEILAEPETPLEMALRSKDAALRAAHARAKDIKTATHMQDSRVRVDGRQEDLDAAVRQLTRPRPTAY